MWTKKIIREPSWEYSIISDNYIVQITGGSVRILDRATEERIKVFKGYTYLYTGDIKPDEKEFIALENGKHFFVYSLETKEQIKRVTLPRFYESIDMYGFYSEDGAYLNIPAYRYIYTDKKKEKGYYEYVLCIYETDTYSLVEKLVVDDRKAYKWL